MFRDGYVICAADLRQFAKFRFADAFVVHKLFVGINAFALAPRIEDGAGRARAFVLQKGVISAPVATVDRAAASGSVGAVYGNVQFILTYWFLTKGRVAFTGVFYLDAVVWARFDRWSTVYICKKIRIG